MEGLLFNLSSIVVFAPLAGALITGLYGKHLGAKWSHRVAITLMFFSFLAASYLFKIFVLDSHVTTYVHVYTWALSGRFRFDIGFLLDNLSTLMITTVTFVSLLVHIYSIGYMKGDPGYQRFFSYISFFTFAMLMLTLANNFLQLFFGWEGVGLASYLLIGFWFKRESAVFGSLKAFLVNRVGDFGFILAIAAILTYFGSVDFSLVFAQAPAVQPISMTIIHGYSWSVLTVICILLFIGAMGKSAQMPLHVWLPESMEGPTPISALIHAATMVTAGIYMVIRMSPLFEYSPTALSFVMIIGATTALFMGIIALVQSDIKRVIAYSTLSQLGYMVAALGASAFSASMFHLVTHACFKALLFLGAGSVILAMHHEQDIRHMGGLRKYMPVTYMTFLVGSLALAAIPPFAGFYSKDAIIEAIGLSQMTGSYYAYYALILGAFITALYTFRLFFLVFHGKERMNAHTREGLKESSWVVWLPLVALAIPSTMLGYYFITPMLYQGQGWLASSILILPKYNVMSQMVAEFHGAWVMTLHSVKTLPFWFAVSGVVVAWLFYIAIPTLPANLSKRFPTLKGILEKKYGFDDFNQIVLVHGSRRIATWCFNIADVKFIDDLFVNGSGRFVQWCSKVARLAQSGYLYHYAFAMILGLFVFLTWVLL